jgi:hypothetical protein
MIRIRSKTDGFMRCGVRHSSDWTLARDGQFTPEQIEILKAEPMLQVQEIEDDSSDDDPSKLTVKELTERLTTLGVAIPAMSKKADLQALLTENLAKMAGPSNQSPVPFDTSVGSEG